jgi:hypothetical protein
MSQSKTETYNLSQSSKETGYLKSELSNEIWEIWLLYLHTMLRNCPVK